MPRAASEGGLEEADCEGQWEQQQEQGGPGGSDC